MRPVAPSASGHRRAIPSCWPRRLATRTLSTCALAIIALAIGSGRSFGSDDASASPPVDVGDRPAELLALLEDGPLKASLEACDATDIPRSRFSIAHRGAPLRLPEHSREGYLAAVEQGAGIVECDVTFTSDGAPVCRHSQCDLHTTTDILATPLASACEVSPDLDAARPFADARCCASDVTLEEFRTLRAKRDGADEGARTLEAYLAGTPGWRGDPVRDYGTPMTLDAFIALLEPFGVAMTPELKAFEPPGGGAADREALSRRMFDAFRAGGVSPDRLYPQSFELDDIRLWRRIEPEYAARSVWLDGRYRDVAIDPDDASNLSPGFDELAREGVGFLAPPIGMLLSLDGAGDIVPSDYALRAKAAGVPLLTWSLERDADEPGGGFYYRSIAPAWHDAGDQLRALDVLANHVGVAGVFSDWPATTSWFAHCGVDR